MRSGELLEQGLRIAVAEVLPFALAAGGAALVVGLIAHRFGLNDPTIVLIARAAAVLAVLAAGGAWFAELTAWSGGLWAQIGEIGQGAS